MAEDEFRVTYDGPAPMASAVAQSLAEAGLSPVWTPPMETRGLETMTEAVTVYYFCQGTDATVRAAVKRIRDRFQGRATLEIEQHSPKPKRRH